MTARVLLLITALLVLVVALLAAPVHAGAPERLRVQATLAELPKTPPCDRRTVTVTARYRVEQILGTGTLPDRTLLVVHRCPEFARGPSRYGRGTAPALRVGQVHLMTLQRRDEVHVTVDRFSTDTRPRYDALLTDIAPESPRVVVVVQGGAGTAHKLSFDGTTVSVGRAPDCDVLLSDVRVALRHLRLDVEQVRAATARRGAAANGDTEEDKVVVQDLGSSSGTRVNGKRITHPTPLTHKDRIEIGPYVLNVSLFSPEQIRRSEED